LGTLLVLAVLQSATSSASPGTAITPKPTQPQPAATGEPTSPHPANAPAKAAAPSRGKRAPKRPPPPPPPPLELYHLNRHDTLVLKPDARYRFPKGSQKQFSLFMRCHHTNRRHAMSPRLLRLLAETSRHFEGHRLLVVAGYRAPVAARNPKSPHKLGLAADFRVEGVSNPDLRDYLRATFARTGVGYYPNSLFVHLDVRKTASAFWIDYSSPGDAPLYSRTPEEDLRSGRADTFKPAHLGEPEGDSGDETEASIPLRTPTAGGPTPQTAAGSQE
jgi:uncharacterized protein YcbK (DUF882 family)